jgi:hypothetical protein
MNIDELEAHLKMPRPLKVKMAYQSLAEDKEISKDRK